MSKRPPGKSGRKVRSDDTLLDILEYLHEENGATVTEVANELGYAKSTVHGHLSTVYDRGYVSKDSNGYYIGLRFLLMGERARNRYDPQSVAKTKVDDLAHATDERAQFIIEEHGEAVYLYRALGDRAVQTDSGIGKRIPLHATAAGKAILANIAEEELFTIIEHTEFDRITDETITDEEDLLDELGAIRDRGYAFNKQENLKGLRAVGVPVRGPADEIIGALSVSGPTHRLKGDLFKRELPNLLLGAANEIELNIKSI